LHIAWWQTWFSQKEKHSFCSLKLTQTNTHLVYQNSSKYEHLNWSNVIVDPSKRKKTFAGQAFSKLIKDKDRNAKYAKIRKYAKMNSQSICATLRQEITNEREINSIGHKCVGLKIKIIQIVFKFLLNVYFVLPYLIEHQIKTIILDKFFSNNNSLRQIIEN
jgi:hypothetical protein